MAHFRLNPVQPRDQQIANTIIRSFDRQYLQRLLLKLIVTSNLPFKFVDNRVLHRILEYLNPSVRIQKAIPNSRTLQRAIYQQFGKHQRHIITILRESPGKLHLSFDGWTSSNHQALFGIMCFFRNKDNKLCKLLLGIPELIEHTNSSISGEVIAVLQSFEITPERMGYFTLDNAKNDTTAMVAIGEKLGFDGRLRRGRCIGHIINLAAKALLFGNNPDAFEEQLDGIFLMNYAGYQLWRTQKPGGKLHNLVVDVRNMHKLYHGFLKVQKKAGIASPL
jgi:hypothetical protein